MGRLLGANPSILGNAMSIIERETKCIELGDIDPVLR